MKLRLILLPVLLFLAFTFLVPLNLWNNSGQAAWLLLVPLLLFLLLVGLLRLAVWGGSAGFMEIIKGQSLTEDKPLREDISIRGGDAGSSYAVQLFVDLDKPAAVVSESYLSFAIDTSQVVGGKWWHPSGNRREFGSGTVSTPLFDFDRPKLDLLTSALAPAYLRIGGSEADKVYYDLNTDEDARTDIPPGFDSVLKRKQWQTIHSFVDRNHLKLVFTLNTGPGNRNDYGKWDPGNARELMAHTAKRGFPVEVWEFGNEMNVFFSVFGFREQVPVDRYCQDLRAARQLVTKYFPKSMLAGQGSAYWPVLGEPLGFFFGYMPEYLEKAGDMLDLVTWHYYPQQSRRGAFASRRATPSRLLDPRYLDEAAYWADKIAEVRHRYASNKPLWLGETGNAQFGGEPGVSDVYIGGLWWLDQLGLMARHAHDVVVRQSLTGMNYGLIDEDGLVPRPDYWNSLLWKRLMGRRVYEPQIDGENVARLRVYAHASAVDEHEFVTILAINLDHQRDAVLSFPGFPNSGYELYAITAPDVLGTSILLNGKPLVLVSDETLPEINAERYEPSAVPEVTINPLSYAFIRFPHKMSPHHSRRRRRTRA